MIMQIASKESKDGLRTTEERFNKLYELFSVDASDISAQLDAIVRLGTHIFKLSLGMISKIEGNQYTVLHVYHPEGTLQRGHIITLKKAHDDVTLRTHDAEAISHIKQSGFAAYPCQHACAPEAYIGVPLRVNGKQFGTLNFSGSTPLCQPSAEEDMRMIQMIGIWVSNILEKQEYQKDLFALKKSETQYKNLVENNIAQLCIHDLQGNILQVNQSLLEDLGYSEDEVIGQNVKYFMKPALVPEFDQYLERIQEQKTDRGIFSILTKSGESRYWSYKNILENDHIQGFSQDITDTIIVQRALQNSERNLKEAQMLAKLGSWNYDILAEKYSWSQEVYHIFERDCNLSELSLTEYVQHIYPDDLASFNAILKTSFIEEKPYVTEHRIVLSSGKIKYIKAKGTPVANEKGDVIRFIGTLQDITEQVNAHQELIKAKEKAEEAAKIKQEFLANTSHEIRTPMNAILGFARLLLEDKLPEEHREYISSIYESAETLLAIINDILDFSKIEAGKLLIANTHFDLRKSLDTMKRLFSVKVDDRIVKLTFDTDDKLPPALVGDPIRINQILNNLINNAIKFTEKGFVAVKTSVIAHKGDAYSIEISVKDTGIGISEHKLQTIFRSFEQAEGDTTRRFGGTGLGLTIVKQLVELMGGTITVESKEGVGSVFSVTLPFQKGNEHMIAAEGADNLQPLPLTMLKGKSILLAEDNRNNQMLAKKVLSDVGCHLDIVENGQIAVEKVQTKHYDLVLMDIQMPVMDGLRATGLIRSMPLPLGDIPVIAMTAHALKEEEHKYRQVGMNDYLSKPFKPEVLYAKMLHALGQDVNLESPQKEETPQETAFQFQMDLSRLEEYAAGDAEFIKSSLEIFLQDVPAYLAATHEALAMKDWLQLKRTVHTLKSSLSLLNMEDTLHIIQQIETARPGEIEVERVNAQCNTIIHNSEQAIKEVKAYLS